MERKKPLFESKYYTSVTPEEKAAIMGSLVKQGQAIKEREKRQRKQRERIKLVDLWATRKKQK